MSELAGDLDVTDVRLVEALLPEERERNAVPDLALSRRRVRAARLAMEMLRDLTEGEGLVTSPLGAAWSSDVDVHVRRLPPASRLRSAGWLSLDGLLGRLGHPSTGRWAATESGEVVGAIDLHLGPPEDDPLTRVIRRCQRSGHVRLREVLELRVLARRGLLTGRTSTVIAAAASAEAALGGSDLATWLMHTARRRPPVAVGRLSPATLKRAARNVRDASRPRLVVAVSGVDGAGKSTLAARVHDQLEAAGVPTSKVWARPGNGLQTLALLARLAKRVLGQGGSDGVEQAAAGERPLRARNRGVSFGWTALITTAFLADAWRQHLRGRGVVVWDRHVLDAVATFDFAYDGPDVTLFRALAQRCLPRAGLAFYLDVPRELAVSRNVGDILGNELAVTRQVDSYRQQLATRPDVRVLDATLPGDELARQVLAAVVAWGDEDTHAS